MKLPFYLLLGAVVAVALSRRTSGTLGTRAREFVMHVALWPLCTPLLLAAEIRGRRPPSSDVEDRVAATERGLLRALEQLAHRLRSPLSPEEACVRLLGESLRSAVARIDSLGSVLAQPGFDEVSLAVQLAQLRASSADRALVEAVEARLEHLRRIHTLWEQARADLELALARASELQARLTLLRFDDPARAAELLDDLCRQLTLACAA